MNVANTSPPFYEIVAAKELARRWCVPESWVREQVRSRTTDPIPHVRLGKYVRFEWGSPQLEQWWNSHRSSEKHRGVAPHLRRQP